MIENVGSSFQPQVLRGRKERIQLIRPRIWEEIWIQTKAKGALPAVGNSVTSLETWNTI